jgi:transposase
MSSSNAHRKHRSFTAVTKAEVVLALVSGSKTQAEICREYEVSPYLLHQWKDIFVANAAAVFQSRDENGEQEAERTAELERVLGRVTLENEMLKKASALSGQKHGGRS